jgi:hypothetical protein
VVENPRIERIEWGRLEGTRPRAAGCNSRIGIHGKTVRPAVARLTAEDGSTGFGVARATRDQAAPLLGQRLSEAFSPERGASDPWIPLEYPLFDLVARRAGRRRRGARGRPSASPAMTPPSTSTTSTWRRTPPGRR